EALLRLPLQPKTHDAVPGRLVLHVVDVVLEVLVVGERAKPHLGAETRGIECWEQIAVDEGTQGDRDREFDLVRAVCRGAEGSGRIVLRRASIVMRHDMVEGVTLCFVRFDPSYEEVRVLLVVLCVGVTLVVAAVLCVAALGPRWW